MNISPWSSIARFSAAILCPDGWKAQWIGKGTEYKIALDWDWFEESELEAEKQRIQVDGRSVLLRKEDNPLRTAHYLK